MDRLRGVIAGGSGGWRLRDSRGWRGDTGLDAEGRSGSVLAGRSWRAGYCSGDRAIVGLDRIGGGTIFIRRYDVKGDTYLPM
jgi:hypothetical protein